MLAWILATVRAEPVATQALVQAAVLLLCAFGLRLAADQIAAVLSFTAAALAWATRQAVTPTAALKPPQS
jgi:hypothetical protein